MLPTTCVLNLMILLKKCAVIKQLLYIQAFQLKNRTLIVGYKIGMCLATSLLRNNLFLETQNNKHSYRICHILTRRRAKFFGCNNWHIKWWGSSWRKLLGILQSSCNRSCVTKLFLLKLVLKLIGHINLLWIRFRA